MPLLNTNLENGSLFIDRGDEGRQGVVAHEAVHTHSKQLWQLGDISRGWMSLPLVLSQLHNGPRDHYAHCCMFGEARPMTSDMNIINITKNIRNYNTMSKEGSEMTIYFNRE